MKRALILANQIGGRPDQEPLRRDGWGYADSRFEVGADGHVRITGNRYALSGETLDKLRPWMEEKVRGVPGRLTAAPKQPTIACESPHVHTPVPAAPSGTVTVAVPRWGSTWP